METGTKILARNWDGSPLEHIFKHIPGFKNLGLFRKVDDVQKTDLFTRAFGVKPKTSLGMVGWTNIKPENVTGDTKLTTAMYQELIKNGFKPQV